MATRENVSKSYPCNSNGEKVQSMFDAAGVRWDFYDLDAVKPADASEDWKAPIAESRIVLLDELSDSAPDDINVINAFAIHGLKAKGGESYASRKKEDKNAWDMLDAMMTLIGSGEWSEGRGESAVSSIVLVTDAIMAVLANEGSTADMTDEEVTAIRERAMLSVKEPESRKVALKRPDIYAEYKRIMAERAAEAAKKAAERARAAKAAQSQTGEDGTPATPVKSLAESLGLVE